LFQCGHVAAAKTDPENRRAAVELASNGFVVLVFDPVCQGERIQYEDPETGEAVVAGGGGVFAHCYAGQQCFYAGANLARFFVHDARCALDHLSGRPDVDGDRLGVTGTSGGGIATLYLGLVDDRVDAAVPCCAVSTRRACLETGHPRDAEQNLVGAIPRGIGFEDLLSGMAPRPVRVVAARSDEYFPVEGAREAVDRLRRAYGHYDARDRADLVVVDAPHASVAELGDPVFEFLCDRLGDGPYEAQRDPDVPDPGDLHCTPGASVVRAYPDERTVDGLIREYVRQRYGRPDPRPGDRDRDADAVREAVVAALDLDRERSPLQPRTVAREDHDGLAVERVFFFTERDPDAVTAGVLASDPDAAPERPAAVLYEEGTRALPDRGDDLARLAREHGAAFAFDPRGVGAVRPRQVPIPPWVEGYHDIYGTEFQHGYDALHLGESLFGMRAFDVLRAVEFLRSETGAASVALVGEGVGAYHALYAATADRRVEAVELRDLGPSFCEMATSREYPYDPRLTVSGAIEGADVPDCLAALADRGATVDRSGE
jgi:dienelactone hydrolase